MTSLKVEGGGKVKPDQFSGKSIEELGKEMIDYPINSTQSLSQSKHLTATGKHFHTWKSGDS
jgi:hypothetical protein